MSARGGLFPCRVIMEIKWTDAHGQPIKCIHCFHRILVGLTHKNKRGNDRIALALRPVWSLEELGDVHHVEGT